MGIAPGSVERLLRALQRKNEWEAYGMAIATMSAGIWPRGFFSLASLSPTFASTVETALTKTLWKTYSTDIGIALPTSISTTPMSRIPNT